MRNSALSYTVRLPALERQLLFEMAACEERRPSDMLRVALREAARRRGVLQVPLIEKTDASAQDQTEPTRAQEASA